MSSEKNDKNTTHCTIYYSNIRNMKEIMCTFSGSLGIIVFSEVVDVKSAVDRARDREENGVSHFL